MASLKLELKRQLFAQGLKNCTNKNCKLQNPQSVVCFGKRPNVKDGLQSHCLGCKRETNQLPHIKAIKKRFNDKPETKKRRLELAQTEKRKQSKKRYAQKAETMEKVRQQRRTPQAKAKRNSNQYRKEKERQRQQTFKFKKSRRAYRQAPKRKQLDKEKNIRLRKENPGKYNSYLAKRRAVKAKATPKWLNPSHIKEMQSIYELSRDLQWLSNEVLVVDHVIPIQNDNVCGLHVPWNLAILTLTENARKSNKCDGTYDNNGWRKVFHGL